MPIEKSHFNLLFLEIQKGNTHAFDELFLRYYDKLLAFSLQYTKQLETAEEITSELFVKIWLKRNELSNVLNPEVYLFVSAKNACMNWIRYNKKRTTLFKTTEDEPLDKISAMQERLLEDKELTRILDLSVAALPEQRRIIFKMVKEQGLKRHEVAEILGISIRTVENQLHKAIITLADAVSSYLGYNPRKKTSKSQSSALIHVLFFL